MKHSDMKLSRAVAAGCLLLATAVAFSVDAADTDGALVVDPALQAKILEQVSHDKPGVVRFTSSLIQAIDNKGNFGKILNVEESDDHALQDNGLWAVRGRNKLPSGALEGSTLSLCGMVQLVNESSAADSRSGTAILPMGKFSVPFGIRSTHELSQRAQITAFDTSAKTLCAPLPGMDFTLHVETKRVFTTSGIFGGTKTVTWNDDNHCATAANYRAASDFGPALKGEILVATCERSRNGGEKIRVEWGFLKDAEYYLFLGQIASAETVKVTYSSADFVPANADQPPAETAAH